MEYRDFLNEVKHDILRFMPSEYAAAQVRVDDTTKNNSVIMSGISIHKEGSVIIPKLYLEEHYQSYVNGASMESVCTQIANEYLKHSVSEQDFDMDLVTNFEIAKENITTKVIAVKNNQGLLCDRPFTKLDDLAIMYQLELGKTEDGKGTIPVTNVIMEKWGITINEIHDLAIDNAERLSPSKLIALESVLFGAEENLLDNENSYNPCTMLVLTNEDKIGGASVLANANVLNEVSKVIDDSFYILPSSVHEVLVVPKEIAKEAGMTPKQLGKMVREVNANEVEQEERLSDHIYEFDKKSKTLETVKASKERKKEVER